MKLIFATTLIASGLLLAGQAGAQGTSNAAGATHGTSSASSGSKPAASNTARSAKSMECSAQADKQGLHGRARKKFRNTCKHGQG